MCKLAFIGTDNEIPEIPFNKESPGFRLEKVTGDELRVADKFSKRHIYFVGGTIGCACHFGIEDETIPVTQDDGSINVFKNLLWLFGLRKKWLNRLRRLEDEQQILQENAIRDSLALVDIIYKNTSAGTTVELYSCDAGDYEQDVEDEVVIDLSEIDLKKKFSFELYEKVTYIRSGA